MIEKIRRWPRWIQWGLRSIGAAGLLIFLAAMAGLGGLQDTVQLTIGGGALAPFMFFDSLPLPDTGITSALMWVFGFGSWFFLGVFLEKLSKKVTFAWLLWIAVYIPANLYAYAWVSSELL